jgi:hypothetical protein
MHGASHVFQAEQGYHLGTHLNRLPTGSVIRDIGHRREHRFALNEFGFGTGNVTFSAIHMIILDMQQFPANQEIP